MKKILFLLLLTVVFGACESDTDSNWNNRPGGNSDDTQNWDSYVITVKNWERIGGVHADNSFFRCVVVSPTSIPRIRLNSSSNFSDPLT